MQGIYKDNDARSRESRARRASAENHGTGADEER
jgi:hypothetical protein